MNTWRGNVWIGACHACIHAHINASPVDLAFGCLCQNSAYYGGALYVATNLSQGGDMSMLQVLPLEQLSGCGLYAGQQAAVCHHLGVEQEYETLA